MTFYSRNGMLYVRINSKRLSTKMTDTVKNRKLVESYYRNDEFFNKFEINKQAGFKENLDKRFILEENLLKKINELEGLEKINRKFEVKADFDGKIYFYDVFKINQWISKKAPIFVLYDNLNYRIVGFCNENDFKLLK